MSAEYRPVFAIPFRDIDKRLEKYGIKVDMSGHETALTGPNGTLVATPDGGSTHFERNLRADTEAVLNAIQTEYGIEIADEDDPRFWGYASWYEMKNERASMITITDRWVVIEGPSPDDVDFTIGWLEAARKAGLLWHEYALDNPEADELWDKLCSFNSLYESRPNLDFGAAAMAFVRKWLKNRASIVLDVSWSPWSWTENFCLMMFAGFFVQTGDRYQMTIPGVIDIRKVHDQLSDWLKRMDQENLSPQDLFATLNWRDARSWEARLMHMDGAARVADRAKLLGG
jgi:hypothetical protein